MLTTTATASRPPSPPAAGPGEPHAALFLALGYMRLPELLACWRVCRRLAEDVAGDPLLWRRIAVERPLSHRLTNGILLKLTERAEGTLRSLRLDGCCLVSDAGLLCVVERNPCITEISVPACIGLTGDGVLKITMLLHERKGKLSRLQLHGISGLTKHHLDIINSLMCKDDLQQDRQPIFYKPRVHGGLNSNDQLPMDVDVCPKCTNIRPVFDCPREACREASGNWPQCRGCYFCIARCEKCGGCIDLGDLDEAGLACPDLMCMDCWLMLPKCSTCNKPYCERHEHLKVPLSSFGQFSCHRCIEVGTLIESQDEGC